MSKEFKTTTKKVVRVVVDDVEYMVRVPAVKDQMALVEKTKDMKDDDPLKTDVLIDFLDGLGLPKKVALDMQQSDLTVLIEEYLLDSKKK